MVNASRKNEGGSATATPDPGREWMLQFQAGDDAAFERIVESFTDPLTRFIRRSIRDAHCADDIAQEAFIRVFNARRRYEPTAAFRTWLFTIASRLCISRLRSAARARAVRCPPDVLRDNFHWESGAVDSVDELEEAETKQILDAAIAALPPTQRAAMALARREELSYREIAESLGRSVAAVKSLLSHARRGLRERLRPYFESGRRPESGPPTRVSPPDHRRPRALLDRAPRGGGKRRSKAPLIGATLTDTLLEQTVKSA